jgi:hypothetical protein
MCAGEFRLPRDSRWRGGTFCCRVFDGTSQARWAAATRSLLQCIFQPTLARGIPVLLVATISMNRLQPRTTVLPSFKINPPFLPMPSQPSNAPTLARGFAGKSNGSGGIRAFRLSNRCPLTDLRHQQNLNLECLRPLPPSERKLLGLLFSTTSWRNGSSAWHAYFSR